MKLDMKMKATVIAAVSRRLMKRHYIRESHLPEIVEPDKHVFQHAREVENFARRERRDVCVRLLRSHKNLVSISRKIWHKRNGRLVFRDDPSACLLFGGDDVLEKHPTGFLQVGLTYASLGFDGFEDKVR